MLRRRVKMLDAVSTDLHPLWRLRSLLPSMGSLNELCGVIGGGGLGGFRLFWVWGSLRVSLRRLGRSLMRFRGLLGAYLVRETLPKVGAMVVEALAVMAKYDPFFEKAGMLRVDYGRDETAIDKNIRGFLEERRFDFKLAKSKAYCRSFFSELDDAARKVLTEYLRVC